MWKNQKRMKTLHKYFIDSAMGDEKKIIYFSLWYSNSHLILLPPSQLKSAKCSEWENFSIKISFSRTMCGVGWVEILNFIFLCGFRSLSERNLVQWTWEQQQQNLGSFLSEISPRKSDFSVVCSFYLFRNSVHLYRRSVGAVVAENREKFIDESVCENSQFTEFRVTICKSRNRHSM